MGSLFLGNLMCRVAICSIARSSLQSCNLIGMLGVEKLDLSLVLSATINSNREFDKPKTVVLLLQRESEVMSSRSRFGAFTSALERTC